MRPLLLEVIKQELRSRGYEEIEPNPFGSGVWSHPDWDGATDNIVAAITDSFENER